MFNENLFAEKLQGLVPYKVDTNTYKARLDANESFISLSQNIRMDFEDCVKNFDFNRYPDPDAKELIEAFSNFYNINKDSVVAANGSDEIISLLMNCFVDFGKSVMTFTPDFSMYAFYATLAGLKVVECPKDENLQIDFEKAKHSIKENKVKLCIFSNPCNPTGKIETKKNIENLASACKDTIFVVDEAYMEFSENQDESFICHTEMYTNIVVLKTISKAIGAASLRLGFAVCDKVFASKLSAAKSPYNVNGISQAFGKIVLENKQVLFDSINSIKQSTKSLFEELNKLNFAKIDKTYTNFVFAKTKQARQIFEHLKKNGILVRCFDIDGGALRITSGTQEENALLVECIKNFL